MSAPGPAGVRAAATEPEVIVVPTPPDASRVAADRIGAALAAAARERGAAHWVTTGGSTPGPIYERLAVPPLRDAVPWERVHLWWGDDRWVPPQDILSNALACWNLLLTNVPVPHDQIHVMPVGDALEAGEGPEVVARRYAATLRSADLEIDAAGFPRMDVILVGIGSDGHLFSVFPGSAVWDDPAWVQAVPAPTHIAPRVERVTLHPAFLAGARLPIAVVIGAAKAGILAEIFGPTRDARRLPAQAARRAGAVWLLDEAAAAQLPAELPVTRIGPTADLAAPADPGTPAVPAPSSAPGVPGIRLVDG
jgi:6-phosphogluconolactonase